MIVVQVLCQIEGGSTQHCFFIFIVDITFFDTSLLHVLNYGIHTLVGSKVKVVERPIGQEGVRLRLMLPSIHPCNLTTYVKILSVPPLSLAKPYF